MSDSFLASTPEDLQRTLASTNRKMQEQEAVNKAKVLNLPYINLQNFPLDLNVLSLFTKEQAVNSESIPFYKDGKNLRIGTCNANNQVLKEKITQLALKYKVELYSISKASLEQTIKFYSKVLSPTSTYEDTVHAKEGQDFQALIQELKDNEFQKSRPITELVSDIFGAALSAKASDIHLEPEKDFLKIRFRIDGVLHDTLHIDTSLVHSLINRLKSLSKLKLNVDNLPQDGRLTIFVGANPIDVRVSSLPSAYGEGMVLRLLGIGANNLKLADLGFQGRSYKIVENALARPNGAIITTGPTGSGKTTTLYAFLNELNDPGVKIITLEDPIEYKLSGIQQTPIDHNVDFNFAKGLRAILRQDPDIVMVGEIRDSETAETALQAALTGHIVLSTLHTNDASGAIPRLITMGARPFIIAPALTIIIAQRLVRKLCQACKKPAALTAPLKTKVEKLLSTIPKLAEVVVPEKVEFFSSPGCSVCNNLGYQGRIGIFEVIEVTESVQSLILKDASALEIKKEAINGGTVSMAQDGLLKALAGVTDVEEVFRVAGD